MGIARIDEESPTHDINHQSAQSRSDSPLRCLTISQGDKRATKDGPNEKELAIQDQIKTRRKQTNETQTIQSQFVSGRPTKRALLFMLVGTVLTAVVAVAQEQAPRSTSGLARPI